MAILPPEDVALVEAARHVIQQRYRPDWHVVGAALRTRSGRTFTGVHLEANVGRVAVCAEAVALGRVATEAGDTDIEVIVAVRHPGTEDRPISIVTPCGMCWEMISDCSPHAEVIVPTACGGATRVAIAELLPAKYAREGDGG